MASALRGGFLSPSPLPTTLGIRLFRRKGWVLSVPCINTSHVKMFTARLWCAEEPVALRLPITEVVIAA